MEPRRRGRDHAAYQELLGAHALDATSSEERGALVAHLATCQTCPPELARLRAAVTALPLSLPEREPSPALRTRLEAAIRGDVAAGPVPNGVRPATAVPPARTASVPSPSPMPGGFWRRRAANPWPMAAGLLLVCSLGLLLWNLNLRQTNPGDGNLETIALQATDAAPDAVGELTYLPDRAVAVLSVRDLPPLAAGLVYEVWLIADDAAPEPAGVFAATATRYAVAVDRERYQALAITVEPGPLGSPDPTSAPLALAPLRPT